MKLLFLLILLGLSSISFGQQKIKLLSDYNLSPISFAKVKVGNEIVLSNDVGIVSADFSTVDTIYIRHSDYKSLSFPTNQLKVGVTEIIMGSLFQQYDEYTVEPLPWQQGETEHPGYIQVLKPRDIALSNPQTSADLLTVGDQVYVQKSQLGGGSPMLRGLSTNRILLSVDGVRMNTAIFRSGNLQNAILIDANAIGATEVIFGPGTVNYGSDALGGVVDYKTLNAVSDSSYKNEWSANTLTRFSTANSEKTAHVDLRYLGKRFVSITSISASDFEDLRMGSLGNDDYVRPSYAVRIDGVDTVLTNTNPNLQVGTGYSQLNLMQKFGWKGKNNWDYVLSSIYSRSSDIPRYDRLTQISGAGLKYAEWNYGPQVWWMNQFTATGNVKSPLATEMKISMANQWFEESRIDRKFGNNTRRTRTEKVNATSINVDFNKEFSKETQLFYGVESILNKVFSEGSSRDIVTGEENVVAARYPNSDWMSFAGYLSLQHWVNKYWHISSGLRYNQVILNSDFDTTFYNFPFSNATQNNGALTGSLGATYNFNGYTYGVNLSTGFRAPNVDDVGKVFDSEPGEVIVPNINLKPEYIYSVDFNFKKEFKNELKLEASAYYSFLNNIIVRDQFLFDGKDSIIYDGVLSEVNALQNKDYAQIYGLTVSATIPIVQNFYLRNTFNYTRGFTKQNIPLRHVAPSYGASHLIFKKAQLLVDFYVNYNLEISNENLAPSELDKPQIYATDSNGNSFSPSWYTLNFKLSYQPSKKVVLGLGVENILDIRYRPYSSGIVAPGRNFIASLKFKL